jgi:hypothetical protein
MGGKVLSGNRLSVGMLEPSEGRRADTPKILPRSTLHFHLDPKTGLLKQDDFANIAIRNSHQGCILAIYLQIPHGDPNLIMREIAHDLIKSTRARGDIIGRLDSENALLIFLKGCDLGHVCKAAQRLTAISRKRFDGVSCDWTAGYILSDVVRS